MRSVKYTWTSRCARTLRDQKCLSSGPKGGRRYGMAGEGHSTAVTLGDPAEDPAGCPLDEDDLKTLIDALYPIAMKYLFFGIQINVKMSEIKRIQSRCTDPNECLLEILSLRLGQFPPLTLYDIDKALRSNPICEFMLAIRIREQYSKQYSSIRTLVTQQMRKRKLSDTSESDTQFVSDSEESVKKGALSETDEASENDTDDSKLLTQERLFKDRDMMETPIKFVSDSEESVKKGALSESSKRDTSVEQSEVMVQHSDYGGKLRKRKKPQTQLLSKDSGIMETPLKTASKTADSDSNSFKHYRQVKRKKHGKARDSSVAKYDTKWPTKSQSHRKRRESNRKRVKMESSSCSSSECNFSSPEDMNSKLSELQNKTIIKVFKSFFGRLCCTIEDPLEIAVQLQEKFLVSRSELENLIKSSDSTVSKTLTLVHTLHRKIKSRPNIIFSTVQVLLQNLALKETAQHMWTEIGNNSPFSMFNGIYLFPYP